jgi:hypothetical protein
MLRANGNYIENIKDYPFMLSPSKHGKWFFSRISEADSIQVQNSWQEAGDGVALLVPKPELIDSASPSRR